MCNKAQPSSKHPPNARKNALKNAINVRQIFLVVLPKCWNLFCAKFNKNYFKTERSCVKSISVRLELEVLKGGFLLNERLHEAPERRSTFQVALFMKT